MSESFLFGKVTLHVGNSLDVMQTLTENSVDSCVCDPPYHLASIVKRFGKTSKDDATGTSDRARRGADGMARLSRGFMGKEWDGGDIAFRADFWAEVYRVLKPGAHLAAFGATRGYHRMACAIEDAGFEIRDSLMWLYSQGFPKSHNLDNKRGDLICGCEGEPAPERGVRSVPKDDVSETEHVSAKLGKILQSGVPQSSAPSQMLPGTSSAIGGSLERDAQSVVEGRYLSSGAEGVLRIDEIRSMPTGLAGDGTQRRLCDGAPSRHGEALPLSSDADGMCASSRPQSAQQFASEPRIMAGQSQSQNGGAWPSCRRCGKPMVTRGLGSALKPAFEPIVLARKPLSEPTVAANVLRWGTGALNIGACRIDAGGEDQRRPSSGGDNGLAGTSTFKIRARSIDEQKVHGRWPANLIHDGSDEVVGAFPSTGASKAGNRGLQHSGRHGGLADIGGNIKEGTDTVRGHDDAGGSAARFFYSAKADADSRLGSKHPTVKPVDLIQYLARLVTPPGGMVLDCFAGTGTTGEAAFREGFNAILIEREAEYCDDIRRRMALVLAGPDERARESIKAKTRGQPIDAGPLFGGDEKSRGGGADRYTESSQTNTARDRADRTQVVNHE